MSSEARFEEALRRTQRITLVVGVAGLIAALIIGLLDWSSMIAGYLTGFVFWTGPALGAMYLLMTHHLSGGRWGWSIRRVAEAAIRTLPLLALLFLPVLLGIKELYEWSHHEEPLHEVLIGGKDVYLSTPFFVVRSIVYFAVWIVLAAMLHHWSVQQDERPGQLIERKLTRLSAIGLIILVLTVTFAFYDWTASLEPEWWSSIYGFYVIVGQAMTAMAIFILMLGLSPQAVRPPDIATPDRLHDLGNLLLVMVILYTYMAFAQYFIIWNGNLPHEIIWYVRRQHNGWEWVVAALALIHFFLPFSVLLSRYIKRDRTSLMKVAGLILAARVLDTIWFVVPSFDEAGVMMALATAAAMVGIGGLWVAVLLWAWRQRELHVPVPKHLEVHAS